MGFNQSKSHALFSSLELNLLDGLQFLANNFDFLLENDISMRDLDKEVPSVPKFHIHKPKYILILNSDPSKSSKPN